MSEATIQQEPAQSGATELPRTFEEFNEQRKQSFVKVKDFRQAGGAALAALELG